ncbi:MAG: GLPGLI family protein, partial [Prevotellaceae bacterium]|nr:GLPGLI family protein [Prevotellaceae bacterium]
MKNLFFLIIGLFYFTMHAHTQVIDSAYFKCTYKLSSLTDLLRPDKRQADEMLLLVGEHYTMFGSYKNYLADSLILANPEEHNDIKLGAAVISLPTGSGFLPKTANNQVFYINRHSRELTSQASIMSGLSFQYQETITVPDWTIENESDSLLGYICQKATSRYGGRDWTAWFTPEITVSEGPWKLRGLPGLILKAEDKDEHYIFECTGLQRLQQKSVIKKDTEKEYRKISKKEFV